MNHEATGKHQLKLIDHIILSDKTTKLVEYDKKKGIIFLLNKCKPTTSNLKLCTIKLTNDPTDDKEEEQNVRIHYVTEVKLNISNSILQDISQSKIKIKPKFLIILRNNKEEKEQYDLYVSLGNKVLVYQRDFDKFIPSFN